MARKFVAVTMLVSFIAMATSGMLMFVIEKPSFTIQMHPVHKLFGLVMTIAAVGHLVFNRRPLVNHFKEKRVMRYGMVLTVILLLLYSVSFFNKLPDHIALPMDSLAAQGEGE